MLDPVGDTHKQALRFNKKVSLGHPERFPALCSTTKLFRYLDIDQNSAKFYNIHEATQLKGLGNDR